MELSEIRKAFQDGSLAKDAYVSRMHGRHMELLEYPALLQGSDVARLEISSSGVVVVIRSSGVRLRFDAAEDMHQTALTLLNFPSYEQEELELSIHLLETQCGDGPCTVFDVGANYGWMGLSLARRFPAARVHAFEPIPTTFQYLRANIAENGLTERIVPHELGLMDAPGCVPFYYDPTISGRTSTKLLVDEPLQELALPVSTVDRFVEEHGARVDFIKCDVEGAELRVFQGAALVLQEDRPLVLTEMLRKWTRRFGYHPNDLIAHMSSFGYQCFRPVGHRLVRLDAMTEDTQETNFFFLHAEAHRGLLDRFVDHTHT